MSDKLKNAWLKYDENGILEVFDFCEGYKHYTSVCKTERESVLTAIDMIEAMGYRDLEEIIENAETLKTGDKVYSNNKDKTLVAFLIGKEPIKNGMRIIDHM